MKKFLLQAFAVAFCLGSGVFVASCDDDNNPVDNPPIDGETAYVVAATTGEASYLVVANSLDERNSVDSREWNRSDWRYLLGI
ncbi:DUF4374 domain-containing protein [Bacteroides ovatus]|uniref:DUF4374 domain-containing protein n=1 Tax=Bacteroides ovatus TaxID=28116 RepID=UPI001EE73CAB|nr:DUF4374 domain-containing protein [Bacteroides ovatus]